MLSKKNCAEYFQLLGRRKLEKHLATTLAASSAIFASSSKISLSISSMSSSLVWSSLPLDEVFGETWDNPMQLNLQFRNPWSTQNYIQILEVLWVTHHENCCPGHRHAVLENVFKFHRSLLIYQMNWGRGCLTIVGSCLWHLNL